MFEPKVLKSISNIGNQLQRQFTAFETVSNLLDSNTKWDLEEIKADILLLPMIARDLKSAANKKKFCCTRFRKGQAKFVKKNMSFLKKIATEHPNYMKIADQTVFKSESTIFKAFPEKSLKDLGSRVQTDLRKLKNIITKLTKIINEIVNNTKKTKRAKKIQDKLVPALEEFKQQHDNIYKLRDDVLKAKSKGKCPAAGDFIRKLKDALNGKLGSAEQSKPSKKPEEDKPAGKPTEEQPTDEKESPAEPEKPASTDSDKPTDEKIEPTEEKKEPESIETAAAQIPEPTETKESRKPIEVLEIVDSVQDVEKPEPEPALAPAAEKPEEVTDQAEISEGAEVAVAEVVDEPKPTIEREKPAELIQEQQPTDVSAIASIQTEEAKAPNVTDTNDGMNRKEEKQEPTTQPSQTDDNNTSESEPAEESTEPTSNDESTSESEYSTTEGNADQTSESGDGEQKEGAEPTDDEKSSKKDDDEKNDEVTPMPEETGEETTEFE